MKSAHYHADMTRRVDSLPADLPDSFAPPEGWQWHVFHNAHGHALRFGSALPQGGEPAGVVVGLQGLSEFTEKYFEVARACLSRNLGFWMMDWQGHGKSRRPLPNREKRHAESFDNDLYDLEIFMNDYVRPAARNADGGKLPLIMLGHSMGANLGLRYLARQPEHFQCAVFTAPMAGIYALRFLPAPLRNSLTTLFGKAAGEKYVFGGTDWHKDIRSQQDKKALSSDPVRRNLQDLWCEHDPELRVGNVTFGWLDAAVKSCTELQKPATVSAIQTPCLLALAGNEKLVENNMAKKLAARLPNAKIITLPHAAHEILMERDKIRRHFWREFQSFLKENGI